MWPSIIRISNCGILLAIIFCSGCADRDRINPVDPVNPDTMGRPTGVSVISIQDTVKLSWDIIELKDLIGYQIYRKTSLESDFTPVILVPATVSSYSDTSVEFDVEYSYQVSAVGSTYESLPSHTVTITPGPTFNWVSDNANGQLVKLTHDAQHELLRTVRFQNILDIETNPITGDVWVIDRISLLFAELKRVSPEGNLRLPILQFTSPLDAALEIRTGALWIADSTDNIVIKLDSAGTQLFTIAELLNPIAVSVDQRTGDCWVADNHANRIFKIKSDGTEILASPVNLNAVQSISVNSSNGDVWVADSTRIVKIDENGNLNLEPNQRFDFAFKIDVNGKTGEFWVLNLLFQFDQSTVSKFSPEGQKFFEISGFTVPEDLSINLFDNSCLVADTQNDRIVRISSGGDIVGILNSIGFPRAVSVQNQPNENNN